VRAGRYRHGHADSAAYRFRLDARSVAVPEITRWGAADDYLIIERDGRQGSAARFKKVFAINPFDLDENGYLAKTEIVDLLDIPDPRDVGRSGTGRFVFPFETPESIVVVDDSTIGIINDNNYPMGIGRHVDTGEPDDSEFILVRIRD
jgi:glycerophosphoryl diester phosphodiesterase